LLNRPPGKGLVFALHGRREIVDEIQGITESRSNSNEFVRVVVNYWLRLGRFQPAVADFICFMYRLMARSWLIRVAQSDKLRDNDARNAWRDLQADFPGVT
jgi:hypothetical protein